MYLQLSQISRPLGEKGGIENRRQRSQTIWGQGHLRPQSMAVIIKNAGNERIFTTKGFGCKNTENDGFSL